MTTPNTIAYIELDSHADTCCFGSNFTPVNFTEYYCDVTPFSEEYSAMKDVPIASAATAWDNPETGEPIILIFHQGLWFGDSLTHSLINPNQVRNNGIEVRDDPYDPEGRPLGIREPETGIEVPMEFIECIVRVNTRAPTIDEINANPCIVMTSDAPWEPAKIGKKDKYSAENISRHAIVSGLTAARNDDRKRSECEEFVAGCSEVYSDNLMLERMVKSVRISSTDTVATESESDSDSEMDEIPMVSVSKMGSRRHTRITAPELARIFSCGIDTAERTLKATTQLAIRHAVHPLSRRYKTDLMQTACRRLNVEMHTDTMFGTVKGIRGSAACQVFTDGDFIWVSPIPTKKHTGMALVDFTHDVGIPDRLRFDSSKEQMGEGTIFMKTVRKKHIHWKRIEPYAHWQNRAENAIKELRRRWRLIRQRRQIPNRLWEYGLTWIAETMSLTVRHGQDRTAREKITGDTPDISEYVDFEFYDWVWYWDMPGGEDNPELGRWLGVAHRIGGSMCYYILAKTGEVISRTSVQHMTREEAEVDGNKSRMSEYDKAIKEKLGRGDFVLNETPENAFIIDDEDEDVAVEFEEDPGIPEADEFPTPELYDEYLNSLVMVPEGDGRKEGRVTKRLKDRHGMPVGVRHQNYLMDTRKYEVEFP
ncbi:MAG: hypothetical protein EYR95_16485, partial [Phormidium sp. SL48-SHIP]